MDEVPIHPVKAVVSLEDVPIHQHNNHHAPRAIVVDMTDTGPAAIEDDSPTKAIDRRSKMVDRQRAVRQVLCYVCCAEFGTNSLKIHHKTCLKKHAWGLENVLHEEGVNKKTAENHRKMCTEPGSGPELEIPTVKCSAAAFEAYNASALEIFTHHSEHCWWCREKNLEAIEELRRRRRFMEEEAARLRRLREEEEARRGMEGAALADELLRRQRETERLEGVRMGEEDEYCAWWQKNTRKVPHGHHKFLHKHEGQLAAHVGAKVQHQKEVDAASKAALKDYSINKAKKDGLLPDHQHSPDGNPTKIATGTGADAGAVPAAVPVVTFTEEVVTAEEAAALVAEEAQMNPGGASAITTTGGEVTEPAVPAAAAAATDLASETPTTAE